MTKFNAIRNPAWLGKSIVSKKDFYEKVSDKKKNMRFPSCKPPPNYNSPHLWGSLLLKDLLDKSAWKNILFRKVYGYWLICILFGKSCSFENKTNFLLNKAPTKRCILGTVSQPSSRFSQRFSVMEIFQKGKCPSRSGHFQRAWSSKG